MNIRLYLSTLALALSATAPAFAQNIANMDIQGKITATLDNDAREWVTFSGNVDGEAVSSANWNHVTISMPDFSQAMKDMAEFLPPEQRAQLDMLQNMDMTNHPMAAMLGQMAGQPAQDTQDIEITISGYNASRPTITMEQSLTVTASISNVDTATGQAIPAELHYVAEAGRSMPTVIYVSGEDDTEASVTFDTLDINSDSGHATGHFQGSLCRMDMRKIMEGVDLSDCMSVEGRFDTALTEEKPSAH